MNTKSTQWRSCFWQVATHIRYPDRVFLLRGNHEDVNTTSTYGFYDECMLKYGIRGEWVYLALINTFNHLPFCALLGEKVLCMHGGLSPYITTLEDIERIPRPSIIPPYGIMCDIVWSDPDVLQMVHGGYRMFAGGRLVTIFSAPNYQNMMNDGCVMKIKRDVSEFIDL
uniref:Serine/threonine-protein phosphatase n=1 Tax=Angiostrongylus cantonensis TaxID=6313 RepID=A0A0K0CTD9_ANGCA